MTYIHYEDNAYCGNNPERLTDVEWRALEAAGWRVVWHTHAHAYDEKGDQLYGSDGVPLFLPRGQLVQKNIHPDLDTDGERWLGGLASEAYRVGISLREAVEEFVRVTGRDLNNPRQFNDGQHPHYFRSVPDFDTIGAEHWPKVKWTPTIVWPWSTDSRE